MNTITYKCYVARVEYDAEDRIFVGHLAGIHDIVGFHGTSVDELESAFQEAVEHYLDRSWLFSYHAGITSEPARIKKQNQSP